MSRRMRFMAACAMALLFCCVLLAQHNIDRARVVATDEELLYLPNEKLLNHFTGGMSSIIADLLWLKCVAYVSLQAQGQGNFEWLNQMVNTVVRLDPYFVDAYRWGGMFLASLKADDDAAVDLLERGIILNPNAWQLPYELAMICLLNRGEEPGSQKQAAIYLSMSVATGKAPGTVKDIAEKLNQQYALTDIERDMWNNLLQSPDALLQQTAARKLKELELRETCQTLNTRLKQYTEATGAPPANLSLLGLRESKDTFGGTFFVDQDGVIKNTTILENQKQQYHNLIVNALDRYKKDHGTFPPDLNTLLQLRVISKIPEYPYAGKGWQYNPETGKLE